ncbi:4'-phosphopantetheinyl transferase family protein [Streptomyces sp. NPDC090442]|uniref:4'-phosphopantetheinyl transferase family protein n=1 Tax=Streptomyces sp. NPDC090442 TaxID=3365962 RepID=UPI0038096D3E
MTADRATANDHDAPPGRQLRLAHIPLHPAAATDPERPDPLLDDADRAALARLTPRARGQFTARRIALHRALGMLLDRPSQQVRIIHRPGHPPQLPEYPQLAVSTSATSALLSVAVSEAWDIGLDIEAVPDATAARHLLRMTEAHLPFPARSLTPREVCRTWTSIEAWSKLTGIHLPGALALHRAGGLTALRQARGDTDMLPLRVPAPDHEGTLWHAPRARAAHPDG